MRERQVRERAAETLVVRVDAVTETGVLADEHAFDDLERHVQDVVGEPASVREARGVAADHAEGRTLARAGIDRHVQPELLARHHAVGHVQPVDAGQEHADQIVARGRRRGDPVDRVDQSGDLGIGDVGQELSVVRRLGRVPRVLLAGGDDDLVHERHAQPRDLHPGPARGASRGGAPDADDRVALVVATLGELRLRHLQRERVDVVVGKRVVARLGQIAAVEQVEHAEIGEERVVGLSGEERAVRRGHDAFVAQRRVVGHRRVADAARHHRRVVHDRAGRVPVHVESLDVIRLVEVQVRVVQRRHRSGVVEERVRVPVVVAEGPPVDRVGLRVGVVVDLDVVADVLAEREEVGPSRGRLERDPVADDRDRCWDRPG